MPRAKGKGKAEPKEIVWGGFVDVKLTDEEKQQFHDWSKDGGQWTYLDDCLADEIKVSFQYDSDTETYLCSLTSVKHAGVGMRVVLTARASTWETSVMLALFKHFILLEGEWGRYLPQSGRFKSEV